MAETRRVRRGAERLLLLAALLLGLVTMHTLGHEPLGQHGATPGHALLGQHGATPGREPLGRHGATPAQAGQPAPVAQMAQMAPMAVEDHDHAGRHTGPRTPAHHSGDSGDPLAVCLAVLGALVVVVGGAALRRAGAARVRTAGVRWRAARRAPPAPITVLDRVAALRI
ncbi:hypothetical protein [Streptomyces sp. NPDC004788]